MKTLINKVTIEWMKAAGIRALRTMAQTVLGMLTIGMAINEVNWGYLLSVAAVSALYSIMTSLVTTLPETVLPAMDGVLLVDTSGTKEIYRLSLNSEVSDLADKKQILLNVEPSNNLSQK